MQYLKEYCQYLIATGQAFTGLEIEKFEADWEPVGRTIRQSMLAHGLTTELRGKIYLLAKGQELAANNG